jgi:hypothetical protein
MKIYVSYDIFKDYLRGYIKIYLRGYLVVIKSLHKRLYKIT